MSLVMTIKRGLNKNKALVIFLSILSIVTFAYYGELRWDYGSPIFFIRSAYENTFIQSLNSRHTVMILSIVGPLLISFAFADIYIEDLESNCISMILTRENKRTYHRNNILAVFILSFLILFIPLMINLLICRITYPTVALDNSTVTPAFILEYNKTDILDILRITYPALYNIVRSIIPSIIFALFSCITYCISLIMPINKYLCSFLSYLIYVGYNIVVNRLHRPKYSLYSYINILSENAGILWLCFMIFIITLLVIILYIIGIRRSEVL